MTLRFIGTTSDDGDCPTLYYIEGTDEILVQGERETDPEHLAQLRDVKESETFVRVPRSLLTRYAPRSDAPELQPFASIAHLFRDFKHTAWRLETRRGYASDRNSPKWPRFLAGEDIAQDPDNSWRENVRVQTAQGKRFERVRLVDEPLAQGQEFLLASAISNVAAGEDIRNLTRAQAQQLRLPEYDFWLFDSKILARFAFDDEDTTLGVYITEDPAEVLAACRAGTPPGTMRCVPKSSPGGYVPPCEHGLPDRQRSPRRAAARAAHRGRSGRQGRRRQARLSAFEGLPAPERQADPDGGRPDRVGAGVWPAGRRG